MAALRRRRVIGNLRASPDMEAVEFVFETGGPIPIGELASSFRAIDNLYQKTTNGEEKLAVTQLRSGSIIAELAPIIPILNHVLPVVTAGNTLSDFTRKIKKAIDGFAELDPSVASPEPDVASEIGQLLKPMAGRKDARFKIARVKYKSSTKQRTVEIQADYVSSDIDRASINADRFMELAALPPENEPKESERNLLQNVTMILHQANRGPARAKGTTGDKGVIEAVTEKPLPVYFVEGVDRLKDRIVGGTKNPLKFAYEVDAWVHRDKGIPKAYTITAVYSAARLEPPKRKLAIRNG